jgi:SPP1 gp7 family putative phage head morphogenesis protein
VAQTLNDTLRDLSVRHKIETLRHAKSIEKELKFLKDLEKSINESIPNQIDNIKTRGLSTLGLEKTKTTLKWVVSRISELSSLFKEQLTPPLINLAENEVEWQLGTFSRVLNNIDNVIDFSLSKPPGFNARILVETTPYNGKIFKELITTFKNAVTERLVSEVRRGLVQGLTTNNIADNLKGTFNHTKRYTSVIVHTTTSGVTSAARDKVFAENDEVIKGVQWVSTLDTKTSDICRGLDGQVFPINSGPRPPAHMNCRSTTVPVLKSFRELGIDLDELPDLTRPTVRDGLAGNISNNKTYEDWLKTQDKVFQREILGTKRFELWSKGKLSLKDFVNVDEMKSLTLEELKINQSKAWKQTFGE